MLTAVPAAIQNADAKTTAEKLVEAIHRVNTYPLCNEKNECIVKIEAKGNTVIGTYRLAQHSSEFPKETLTNIAEKLRPAFVRDTCGALGKDFPDKSMRLEGHYYTKDGRLLATTAINVSECFP